jgi:hypothetical protein
VTHASVPLCPRLPLPPNAGKAEGDLERAVHAVFDGVIVSAAHPRTVINVDVQVIHDDGALLPAVLNCVTLALVDAGIPIDGMVAAVSAGLTRPDADGGAAAAVPVIPALAGREAPDGGVPEGAPVLDLLASEEGRSCRVAGAYAFKGPQQAAAAGGGAPIFTRQAGAGSWDDTQTLLDAASTAAGTVLAFLRLAAQNKVARDGVNLGLTSGLSEAGR